MPYADPEKAKQNQRERYQQNREKVAARQRAYYQKHKEERAQYAREYRERHRKDGIPSQVDANRRRVKHRMDLIARFLAEQGGMCAICGSTDPGSRGWQLDHDHECCPTRRNSDKRCGNCDRGALCHACNIGLGHFKDDPDTMRAAIAYLAKSGE